MAENNLKFKDFFKGKKVLITGHTGFKGAWLSIWLQEMGAHVVGYSLDPPYNNSLFEMTKLGEKIIDIRADVRDITTLEKVFGEHKPEIIFHLAAQSLVRLSYDIPRETFETNIMGVVNILECLKKHPYKSAVIVTSDKCYKNIEQTRGYVESDPFSNQDPYSCSKGCTEIVVESYRNSFDLKVATGRAGNVIGGGDWGKDRLIPDIIRALEAKKDITIRNPESVRPWQFVLESLTGYLLLAKKQYEATDVNSGWNFGPERDSMITVKELVNLIIKEIGKGNIVIKEDIIKPEAGILYLDCTKAKKELGWKPILDIHDTIKYTVDWYKNYKKQDVYQLCVKQIKEFEASS